MSNLIYFTLGYNENYLNLIDLCIESLYKNNYDGDFLFISEYKDKILNKINFKKTPYFIFSKNENMFQSSANKFKIHEFNEIQKFEKIIFCDSDILFLKNPKELFDKINENKVFMCKENHLMSHELWGGNLLNNEEKENIAKNKIYGMNAGFFGFNSNIAHIFKDIEEYMYQNLNKGNCCLEQPYLNVYLYRNDLYDNSFSEEVTAKGYHLDAFNGTAIHFTTESGNYQKKYDKMVNFIQKNKL